MQRLPITPSEECIGLPTRKWINNCHLIAHKLISAGCFEGVARYGMYTGEVDDDCPVIDFIEKYEDGIPIRHGWIEQDDGTIIDPTRWVFEGDYPYIAVISEDDWEHDEYDPGMQQFKKRFRQPPPDRNDPRPNVSRLVPEFKPEGKLLEWIMQIKKMIKAIHSL